MLVASIMAASFQDRLRKYARLTIRAGVAARPGQEIIIGAEVSEAPFTRMLVEEAYKAGAKNVFVQYLDDEVTLSRYAHASPEALEYGPKWFMDAVAEQIFAGAAYLRVFGTDPALLKDVDKAKIGIASKAQAIAGKRLSESVTGATDGSFCIVGHSSPGWAKAVFPDLSEEAAVSKLWDAIFAVTCVDTDDPVATWNAHVETIEKRRDNLNSKGIVALHITGNGTDLKIGLADGHRFAGGRLKRGNNPAFSPNIPTEEVFTMPHKDRVDGVVRSSKPLSVRGSMIDGIEMHFEKGRVTKASAQVGEEVLLPLLDTDEGAKHLGEVALVPNSSRVSKANMLFLNTLYDENAACHIAMGKAIGENMKGYDDLSADERAARGVNDSLIHVDWMIGCAETNVDGITADGSVVPVMRGGEFV
jgi:aminopeptidase